MDGKVLVSAFSCAAVLRGLQPTGLSKWGGGAQLRGTFLGRAGKGMQPVVTGGGLYC
jgi:hypothetical protein